jgi:hypothetical protein
MRLKWGHFCSKAEFDNGIWTLHDLADGYGVRPDGMLGLGDPTQLALLFHAHANEPQVQQFRLNLTDSKGKSHSDPGEAPVHFVNVGDDLPRVGPKRITLTGWKIPGTVGDLTFNVYDGGGQRLGRISLPVYPADTPFAEVVAPVPVGTKLPKQPFRMAWAHLAEGCEIHPETHTLTLHKVFDSTQLLPNIDFLILAPVWLALKLTGHPAAGPDHMLTIRAFDEDGKPLNWEIQREIRFIRPKEGVAPLCNEVFNLSELMVGGTIEFKVYVGEKYVDSFVLNAQKLKNVPGEPP